MSGQPIDTDCMTLTRFILAEQKKHPEADGNLSQLLTSLQSAIKAISAAVRRAGISNLFGAAGTSNVQGEQVKKLDVLSNELFINQLTSSYTCCMLISEENETVIESKYNASDTKTRFKIMNIWTCLKFHFSEELKLCLLKLFKI